jgi:hypothetical protein
MEHAGNPWRKSAESLDIFKAQHLWRQPQAAQLKLSAGRESFGGIAGQFGCKIERVSVSRLQWGHWKKWAILTGVFVSFDDEYHFISVRQNPHTGDCKFSTDLLRSSAISPSRIQLCRPEIAG